MLKGEVIGATQQSSAERMALQFLIETAAGSPIS